MKMSKTLKNGLTFEIEGATEVELFRQIAKMEETFGEKSCGVCQSEDIKFAVRNVTVTEGKKQKNYEYFENRCNKCGALLSYGQHLEGGTLFPKRKSDDGKYDHKARGWHKFEYKKETEETF